MPVTSVLICCTLAGNEYLIDDLSSETVISYAIAHLGVRHIIVMGEFSSLFNALAAADRSTCLAGHTKCGAVRAAIASPSKEVITNMDETRIDVRLALLLAFAVFELIVFSGGSNGSARSARSSLRQIGLKSFLSARRITPPRPSRQKT